MAQPRQTRTKARAAPRRRGAATGPAAPILEVLSAMAGGNLDVARLDPARFADPALRQVAQALNAAVERTRSESAESAYRLQAFTQGVDEAIDSLVKMMVKGDLAGGLRLEVADASLAPLIAGLGQVMETLKRFVTQAREASLQLSTSAAEVLAAATQNEHSTAQQAGAVHETTATMEELKGASQQIADNAQTVASIAEQTLSATRHGEGAIRAFLEGMEKVRKNATEVDEAIGKLSRRVERIGTVVEVIDEIVAAEMRRLAENVLESTREIKNLIAEIREATHAAKEASDGNRRMATEGEQLGTAAIGSVSSILKGAEETAGAARVIHLATQQQRSATEQVVTSMSEVEEVTRQAQAGSRQATGAAAELTRLAERLAALVERFRVE
jgi:methyl-accepting chemotaxis protein